MAADSATLGSNSGWQAGMDALKQGQVSQAVALLQEHVSGNPNSFEGRNFLGVALSQLGRHQEAVEQLQQAVRLNAGSAQAHYNLSVALKSAGDEDNSLKELETALKLDPTHPQASKAKTVTTGTPDAVTNSPWDESSAPAVTPLAAGATEGVRSIAPAILTPADLARALAFGIAAAVIGAVIWDKVTYYSNYKIGIIAAGVGFLVGTAVTMGAGGKTGPALQVIGAVLAGCGILLGQALIVMDTFLAPLSNSGSMSFGRLLWLSVELVPVVLRDDPLTLLFVAFGIYEGWKIPGTQAETTVEDSPDPAKSPEQTA